MRLQRCRCFAFVLTLGACSPVVRMPGWEVPTAPISHSEPPTARDSAAARLNPGKILLIGVGAVCAVLVLVLILEGQSLSD
jgi:hypothetical protein